MTMIEKVAEAISAHTLRRDSYLHDAAAGDRCVCAQCAARAAIKAMREPMPDQIVAGTVALADEYRVWAADIRAAYRAMIDAALREKP